VGYSAEVLSSETNLFKSAVQTVGNKVARVDLPALNESSCLGFGFSWAVHIINQYCPSLEVALVLFFDAVKESRCEDLPIGPFKRIDDQIHVRH
jgi:hypothetical protein